MDQESQVTQKNESAFNSLVYQPSFEQVEFIHGSGTASKTRVTSAELVMPFHAQHKSDMSSDRAPDDLDNDNDESQLQDISGEVADGDAVQWPRKIVMGSSETEPDEIEDSEASDYQAIRLKNAHRRGEVPLTPSPDGQQKLRSLPIAMHEKPGHNEDSNETGDINQVVRVSPPPMTIDSKKHQKKQNRPLPSVNPFRLASASGIRPSQQRVANGSTSFAQRAKILSQIK